MLVRLPRGFDISAPAINLLNENPSLVALGKLTHTNPRAAHEPTNPQTHKPVQCIPAQPSPAPLQINGFSRGSIYELPTYPLFAKAARIGSAPRLEYSVVSTILTISNDSHHC